MRHGFLLIDKPEGPTSHDIVATVRKRLSERKMGHLGTLDPVASGLLVLAVGAKALKVVELFSDLDKEYKAEIRFGAVSATYDREGPIEEVSLKPGIPLPDEKIIQNAIEDRFLGRIEQIPPAYSAVKIGGERAYRKMRQGRAVDLPAREVHIDACDIESFSYPNLTLRIRCGSGTYIRSLAHDLGQMLRVGAYLASLRRTKVGEWSVDHAVTPEEASWTDVPPLKEVLQSHPGIEITAEEFEDIRCGRNLERGIEEETIAWHDELPVAILRSAGDGISHARKVF